MSATLQQLFGKCDFEGGPLAGAQVQGIEANRKENTLEVSLLAPHLLGYLDGDGLHGVTAQGRIKMSLLLVLE